MFLASSREVPYTAHCHKDTSLDGPLEVTVLLTMPYIEAVANGSYPLVSEVSRCVPIFGTRNYSCTANSAIWEMVRFQLRLCLAMLSFITFAFVPYVCWTPSFSLCRLRFGSFLELLLIFFYQMGILFPIKGPGNQAGVRTTLLRFHFRGAMQIGLCRNFTPSMPFQDSPSVWS